MKFSIKNLKQQVYEVEVDSEEDSILTLKKKFEEKHGISYDSFKLVYNSKILENDKLVKDYGLQEGNVIIMMNVSVKPKIQEKKEEEKPNTNTNTNTTSTTKTDQEKKTDTTQSKPQPKPQQPKVEKNYDNEVATLVDMGFSKDESLACVKAAKGNVQLALEFLERGIPDNLPDFGDDGANFGDDGMGGMGGMDSVNEDALLSQIASVLKIMCQSDESQLEAMLQILEEKSPPIFALITKNQDKFKELLAKPISEEDRQRYNGFLQTGGFGVPMSGGSGLGSGLGSFGQGGSTGTGNPQITRDGKIAVSQQDMEVVNRLKAFGFEALEILDAYYACDKNEELTLNLLLDNKAKDLGDDIDIDYSQFDDGKGQGDKK